MDDARLARMLAEEAGRRLLEVRAGSLEGRELKAAGDAAAQEVLAALLAEHRPHDAVLSEEAVDDRSRLSASRVWVIDPLDGTREFSERPRTDWAVHVALWQDNELVAGAVTMPAAGIGFDTGEDLGHQSLAAPLRLAVSRSRPPAFVEQLAEDLDATLVPMGSAGVKAMSVLRGETDAYVHAGGQFEWDSAAPVAVARAAGLHTSRIDGSPLRYNQADPSLPDLVICHPDAANTILNAISRQLDEARLLPEVSATP
jgi:3'(2'), 5'-bisphosphate nucleotidase